MSLKPATITVGNPMPLPAKNVDEILAGSAKVDITPPPGIPLAGHSLAGKIAKGVRTRLYARVLYLKPKSGRPVVLVQADLLSGSRILHHRVAELIAPKTDVEAGGLVIAGTHTHSAQGNYFGEAFYDRMASPEPGFQKQLYDFMAETDLGRDYQGLREPEAGEDSHGLHHHCRRHQEQEPSRLPHEQNARR